MPPPLSQTAGCSNSYQFHVLAMMGPSISRSQILLPGEVIMVRVVDRLLIKGPLWALEKVQDILMS